MRVRAYLLLMALAIAIPIIIFSTVALNMLLGSERRAALRTLHEMAHATALLVDRELSSAEAALRVLALSPHLAAGNMRSFYDHAKTADRGDSGRTILFAPNGQQIINTVIPLGESLPPPPSYVTARTQQVIQTQTSVVSGLITGAVQQRPVTTINIPVPIEKGQRYVLASVFGTDYFQKLITSRQVPATWIVAVIDRDGNFIARSGSPIHMIGRSAHSLFIQKAARATEGQLRYTPPDGVEVYEAFTRSPLSGWTISVTAPVEEIEASARRAVITVFLGLLVALMAALGAATLFGRRLVGSIASAARFAAELGHGKMPQLESIGVTEIDDLHRALKSAGMVLAASEIERAALLKSEQEARRIAEQENKLKDDFLAMLGHELRNPLSGITGAVERMEIEGADEERRRRARAIVRRQSEHLTHIVDDLLDLARLSKGKVTLHMRAVDLGQAVQSSAEALRAAGRNEHALTLDIEPVWIMADHTRLEQIINNLLTNAFKYTPAGGRVKVRVYPDKDEAVMVVQDTGIGISTELMPRLFDIFIQGSISLDRSEGGLGIGLSLVRSLVQSHHGKITAESAGHGLGSTFTVRFPRTERDVSTHDEHGARRGKIETLGTVLVIEDNDDARHVLAEKLASEGLRVLEAIDGRAGIQSARTNLPDVAVVDIGLPELTGYEVARYLRADEKTSHIRLIAMTGYGQETDRQNAFDAGFDAHFSKPARFEHLIEEIRRLNTRAK